MEESTEQTWFQRAAEKIVRERKNLYLVLIELGIDGLTQKEAENIYKSKDFQVVLRQERNRYYMELGQEPTFAKDTAVGQMLHCIEALITEGKFDKALEGLAKLAKLKGWTEADVNIVFGGKVTDKDILEAKKLLGIRDAAIGTSKAASN